MPEWLIPVLTFMTGGLGGYLGASRKVIVLEARVADLLYWQKGVDRKLGQHGEDLLIHDTEIDRLCEKTGVPRVRRQLMRES